MMSGLFHIVSGGQQKENDHEPERARSRHRLWSGLSDYIVCNLACLGTDYSNNNNPKPTVPSLSIYGHTDCPDL
jgi:hypothetical protein